jgi:hypothetical protein
VIVNDDPYAGFRCCLAVDRAGRSQIAYLYATPEPLLEPRFVSEATGWTEERIDTTGAVGDFISLALDAAGQPQAAYQDILHQDLKYAYRQ